MLGSGDLPTEMQANVERLLVIARRLPERIDFEDSLQLLDRTLLSIH